MSHIDTAYKLGALKAMEDFKEHLAKQAQGFQPGQSVPPAPSTSDVAAQSPSAVVRGSNIAANPRASTVTPTAPSAPRQGAQVR